MSSWNKGETDLQNVSVKSMEKFAALDVTYVMVSIRLYYFKRVEV
jgi:hypothetical protein